MTFPVSGVTVHPLIPLVGAYFLTLIMSWGGVSGAFLLLPFQVSVLGFVSPAVTPTNHLFNVIATPSGVYRYVREGRMLWPLALVIVLGTIPGLVVGSLLRIYVLADIRHFKLFIGFVLLLIGSRLAAKVLRHRPEEPPVPGDFRVHVVRFDRQRLEYEFQGRRHGLPVVGLGCLALVIGVIGGAYGVGGGAIIAPVLVSLFRLPVHTIAGSTLLGTGLTSLAGVILFTLGGWVLGERDISPDWALGSLFGIGGLLGMYSGARLQKYIPARLIESVLALVVNGLALTYIVGFFW